MEKPGVVQCPRCNKGKIPYQNFVEMSPDGVIKAGEYRHALCPECGIRVVLDREGNISFPNPSPGNKCPYCERVYSAEEIQNQVEGYESLHGKGSFPGDIMHCFKSSCNRQLWLSQNRNLHPYPPEAC